MKTFKKHTFQTDVENVEVEKWETRINGNSLIPWCLQIKYDQSNGWTLSTTAWNEQDTSKHHKNA